MRPFVFPARPDSIPSGPLWYLPILQQAAYNHRLCSHLMKE